MRRHISATTLIFGLCTLTMATLATNLSFSQGEPSPQEIQLTRMTTVQVKPGMGAEFEDFVKTVVIPALRKGGATESGAWKTAIFGEADHYVMTGPIASIAELDEPNPLVKALGQEGLASLTAKIQKLITSMSISMVRMRPDLGINLEPGYEPKMGWQVKASIAPGRNADFEKAITSVMELVKKSNAKGAYAAQTVIGGNPNDYYILVLLDSFTDMEEYMQSISKEMAQAKLPDMTGVVTEMEYKMYSYMPELSIQAPAQ